MTREEEISRLYTHGWEEKPEWARMLRWNYTLWTGADSPAIPAALLSYCQDIQGHAAPDKRIVGADGSPYLDRYCIAEPLEAREEDLTGKIYLDHIWRSDADQELHSHPWDHSVSLILVNGYEEERRGTTTLSQGPKTWGEVHRFDRRPGDVVEIDAKTFHRIDLPRGEAWTLFFVGRFVDTWYFWNRTTGVQEQWRDFLQARGRLR